MYGVDIFQIYGSFTHRSSIILSVIINSGQKWRNFKAPKNDVMNLKEYDIDKLTISGSLESIFKFVTELTENWGHRCIVYYLSRCDKLICILH